MFFKTPNTLGTPCKRSEHASDLIVRPQWAHTTVLAGYLFICWYLRRDDEDLRGYKRDFLADYAWDVG